MGVCVSNGQVFGEFGVGAQMAGIGGMQRMLTRPLAAGVAAITADTAGEAQSQDDGKVQQFDAQRRLSPD